MSFTLLRLYGRILMRLDEHLATLEAIDQPLDIYLDGITQTRAAYEHESVR